MGSIFDGLFTASAVPLEMEYFARDISYIVGSVTTALKAIVGDINQSEREALHGLELEDRRDVTISMDPDSEWGGVSSPTPSASLVIDNVAWAIDGIGKRSENFATLNCVRRPSVERSRPELRGAR